MHTQALTTIAIALSVMVALLVLVERTRFGRAMRAVAENPQVASLMGIS
ncbi:ABC transporter permease subunit, partial [Klebsiella variicola]